MNLLELFMFTANLDQSPVSLDLYKNIIIRTILIVSIFGKCIQFVYELSLIQLIIVINLEKVMECFS